MILKSSISPTDLRDYAKAKGWVLLKEAAKDHPYVMTHPTVAHRQLGRDVAVIVGVLVAVAVGVLVTELTSTAEER